MENDSSSLHLLKEQVAIARKKRNYSQVITATGELTEKYMEQLRYSEALDSLYEMASAIKKLKKKELLGDVCLKKGNIHSLLGHGIEAETDYKKALILFESFQNKIREIETRTQLAILFSFQGKYADSLHNFHKALQYYSSVGDNAHKAFILGRIGHLYTEQEDYTQGLELNLEALHIYQSLDDKRGIWECLWGIGFIYLEQKQGLKAAQIFAEMESISDELASSYFTAGTLCGKGMALALAERFDEAVSCELEALRIAQDLQAKRNEALILRFLGQIYILMGRHSDAIAVLQRSLKIVEQRGLLRMQFLAHELLSAAFEKNGNTAAAFTHFKKFVEIQNNVRGNIRQHELTQLRMKIEETKHQYESEILRLRAVNAEQEIQQKKKELSNLCAGIARQHETLEKIRQDVLHIVHLTEKRRSPAKPAHELLQKITSLLKNHDGMALFERQFDSLHQSFLKNLIQSYPALTPTELKICSLLRINLTTKEIANLLCISVATADLHRSHIRKKIGLSAEQNLTSFLASV
ncbi:MAG TPA: tetratricopeptide repeat protein [Patescibacteria group bacterium]|nr:tetratricopeptide repeat protein [Patescibacteria group bacterium]